MESSGLIAEAGRAANYGVSSGLTKRLKYLAREYTKTLRRKPDLEPTVGNMKKHSVTATNQEINRALELVFEQSGSDLGMEKTGEGRGKPKYRRVKN